MLNSINATTESAVLPENAPRQQKAQHLEEVKNAETAISATSVTGETSAEKAVEKLNKAMASIHTEQEFVLDEDLNRPIVKILNKETKEVIRQIPTEEAIRISKNIGKMLGLLLDDKI